MPILDGWEEVDTAPPECPLCESVNTSLVDNTAETRSYLCEDCSHRWEEYK